MGNSISYTIGGYGSRIGLRVLDGSGKMASATPLSDAQAAYFDELDTAEKLLAMEQMRVEIERAKAVGAEPPRRLPPHDTWQRFYKPVPEDMLPDRVCLKTGKSVDGFYSDEGITYVSGRLKGIIEEFDPGRHQFKKLEAVWRDGTPYEADEIYAFKVCQMLNAVDDSHPKFTHYGDPGDPLHGMGHTAADSFDMYSDVINGAGMWYEQRLSTLFVSDAFIARLRAERIPGWETGWHAFREV